MSNWNEGLDRANREAQEAARRKEEAHRLYAQQQRDAIQRQQQEQEAHQQALRDLPNTLRRVGVVQMLEDVRSRVWQGYGRVVNWSKVGNQEASGSWTRNGLIGAALVYQLSPDREIYVPERMRDEYESDTDHIKGMRSTDSIDRSTGRKIRVPAMRYTEGAKFTYLAVGLNGYKFLVSDSHLGRDDNYPRSYPDLFGDVSANDARAREKLEEILIRSSSYRATSNGLPWQIKI